MRSVSASAIRSLVAGAMLRAAPVVPVKNASWGQVKALYR